MPPKMLVRGELTTTSTSTRGLFAGRKPTNEAT